MSDWLTITEGSEPLIISIPHAGMAIPDDVCGFRSRALAQNDADHHVDKLYAFAQDLGATIVSSHISRSVIDLNRDPSGRSLYPGQVTTGLCPVSTFDGEPLYEAGVEPDAVEIARRRAVYFDPYHAALQQQIDRLSANHRAIVLYDAHSIRSHVPRLFEGELPRFNIGTNGGKTCALSLEAMLAQVCNNSGHSWIANGRFKGGWITRHYGDPARGIHAVQMELAMRGYLDEDASRPPLWDGALAAPMQRILTAILYACLVFAKDRK